MTGERTSETDQKGPLPVPLSPPRDPAVWLDLHGVALFRFARARVGRSEIAEDLVQDTLLAALQSLDRFEGRSSERTWLLSILRRKIVDYYREGDGPRATGSESLDESLDGRVRIFQENGTWLKGPAMWVSAHEALENEEFRQVLDHCLEHLPRPLAEAFLLREREILGVEAVGELLDVSAGNLRVRLHRARLLLRECLEQNWFGL